MKKTLIMLSMCILFFGCMKDWGTPSTKNYPINSTYSSLDVSGSFHVTFDDQVTDVAVTVGDLAHQRVIVNVVNGCLHIGFKPNTNYNGTATAVIPTSVLRELDLSGASSFTGNLSGDDVDIELSGSSEYSGDVFAKNLDIDLSGASSYNGSIESENIDIDLSGASRLTAGGTCQTMMEIGLSGASQLHAADLHATAIHGDMSGSSHADVTCCSSLNASLSGSSTLVYGTTSDDCHPVVNCTTSGSSSVRPRQ